MSYRWWLIAALVLFTSGIVIGTMTPDMPLSRELTAGLKELSRIVVPFSPLTIFIIFFKNSMAILMSFALSPFFCLIPALSLLLNGWVIGFISSAVIQKESLLFLLAGVAPHGIFELPAMIIGGAASLGFGATLIMAVFRKAGRATLVSNITLYLKFLVVAIILLFPAAIMETYVTPMLIGK